MTANRTDLHRPSVINPADYEFISLGYTGVPELTLIERQTFMAHMAKTGGKFARITRTDGEDGSFGCDVCGARCLYTAKFYHVPTNTYITTGMDCAAKMDIADPILFADFRKRIAAGLKTRAGKAKAQDFLAAEGLERAWEISQMSIEQLVAAGGATFHEFKSDSPDRTDDVTGWYDTKWEERTITDIVNKLVAWGSISEKQVAFLKGLLEKIDQRAARDAERAAAAAERLANGKHVPATDARV